jgi:hypothetical protein
MAIGIPYSYLLLERILTATLQLQWPTVLRDYHTDFDCIVRLIFADMLSSKGLEYQRGYCELIFYSKKSSPCGILKCYRYLT